MRSVPVIRPHSWHLAKLSEVQTETSTSIMHFPPDSFSLSWHSGCETSDLSMQWNQLSHHCSTDRSSSLGSMDSLDQPGQNCHEESLSLVDQSVYQNKRDSAYSSFSASSNTSDNTLPMKHDISASVDNVLHGLGPHKYTSGNYYQTSKITVDDPEDIGSASSSGNSEHSSRSSSLSYDQGITTSSLRVPPRPPVRRDSLRAAKHRPISLYAEKGKVSSPTDMLPLTGRWTSDTLLSLRNKEAEGKETDDLNWHCKPSCRSNVTSVKDNPLSGHFYRHNSHVDTCQLHTEAVVNKDRPYPDGYSQETLKQEQATDDSSCNEFCSAAKVVDGSSVETPLSDCGTPSLLVPEHLHPHPAHRHSAPEQLLSAQLSLLSVAVNTKGVSEVHCTKDSRDWTVSPLHSPVLDHNCPKDRKSSQEQLFEESTSLTEDKQQRTACMWKVPDVVIGNVKKDMRRENSNKYSSGQTYGRTHKQQNDLETTFSVPGKSNVYKEDSPPLSSSSSSRHLSESRTASRPECSTDPLEEEAKDQVNMSRVTKKRPAHFRTAKMRHRSDRFATNLRNEIQKRKAQLQKNKVSSALLYGEETVEEVNEVAEYTASSESLTSSVEDTGYTKVLTSNPSEDLNEITTDQELKLNRTERYQVLEDNVPHSSGVQCKAPSPFPETVWKAPSPPPPLPASPSSPSPPPPPPPTKPAPHKTAPPVYPKTGRCKILTEQMLQSQINRETKTSSEKLAEDLQRSSSTPQTSAETVLLPFEARKKFFEESSKSYSTSHLPSLHLQQNKPVYGQEHDSSSWQPPMSNAWGLRRRSVDHIYHQESFSGFNATPYSDDPSLAQGPEHLMYYTQGKSHSKPECCRCAGHCIHGVAMHGSDLCCSGTVYSAPCKRSICPSSHYLMSRSISCCCPSHSTVMEEYNPMRNVHLMRREMLVQEIPMNDWEEANINRTFVRPESDMAHYKMSFPAGTSMRQCCEPFEKKWTHHRTRSAADPSFEWSRPCRTDGEVHDDSMINMVQPPLRGRAFSESNLGCAVQKFRSQDERKPVLAKVEENRTVQLPAGKKKGPPPPRPPPPNWEKYRARQGSQHNLNTVGCSSSAAAFQTCEGHTDAPRWVDHCTSDVEVVKQRSQSLPISKPSESHVRHAEEMCCRSACSCPRLCEVHSSECLHLEMPSVSHKCCNSGRILEQCLPMETDFTARADISYGGRDGSPEGDENSSLGEESSFSSEIASVCKEFEKNCQSPGESYFTMNSPDNMISVSKLGDLGTTVLPLVSVNDLHRPEVTFVRDEMVEKPRPVMLPKQPGHMSSEELMRVVANSDRSLAGILNPGPQVMASDLVGDIFQKSTNELPGSREQEQKWNAEDVPFQQERRTFEVVSPVSAGSASPTSCSAYYNISTAKAELLNKMKELPEEEEESEEEIEDELTLKKQQLIDSLSRKLAVLQGAQKGLLEDISANTTLGEELEVLLKKCCKANEFEKFRTFIGDLDKVVNLLLSLSGRLARVENALNSLDPVSGQDEQFALLEKKKQLSEQLEDAKELKEHVSSRERVVYDIVARYLTEEQLQDYEHFVKMKSALIIEQRELEDKIRLGEEQLRCLKDSLTTSQRGF
ncbi:protein Shroom4 isoform X2 [Protopterus annectens]|uniref:protein Shroom4 isoform X2 n=1 Tax=Protopterus annectens TaxID=7888 RepID=UPI001CFB2731|nr:protein Shroom4 isoform X2 [Protopterus annectens]